MPNPPTANSSAESKTERSEDMRIVGQVFPWDLTDGPRRSEEWQRAGVNEVAVAANYHAVRAISWMQDGRPRIIHLERSAYYLPVGGRWEGNALAPHPPTGMADDLFVQAARIAADAGLRVRAWIILTHNDGGQVAENVPFGTVDLWGNVSSYALCPSFAEVRQRSRWMIEDVVRQSGVRHFLIEGLSALGFRHLVAHDKTEFALLADWQFDVLSLCFCTACSSAAESEGWSFDADRAVLRQQFTTRISPGRIDEIVDRLSSFRERIAHRFVAELAEPVDATQIDIDIASTTKPGFGAFATLTQQPTGIRGLCADLSDPQGQGWSDVRAWSLWDGIQISGTLSMRTAQSTLLELLMRGSGQVQTFLPALDELYLYHLGLRHPATLSALRIDDFVDSL